MIKNSYALNKVLEGLAKAHIVKHNFSEEELAGYALTPQERDALLNGDTTALYELGANPYFIRAVFRPRFKV